jgi:hypothetical protein
MRHLEQINGRIGAARQRHHHHRLHRPHRADLVTCTAPAPHAAEQFAICGRLRSYRAMLDHEGYPGPQDAALIGNEKAVTERIDELRGAGVDEFVGLSLRPLPRTPRPHPRTPARVRRYNRAPRSPFRITGQPSDPETSPLVAAATRAIQRCASWRSYNEHRALGQAAPPRAPPRPKYATSNEGTASAVGTTRRGSPTSALSRDVRRTLGTHRSLPPPSPRLADL